MLVRRMKFLSAISVVFLSLLLACQSSLPKDNQKKDTLPSVKELSMSDSIKPVFGYRFVISGDFDGDGKNEKLIEHFYSKINNKETFKFYEGLADYNQLVDTIVKIDPISFITSDNSKIDSLTISSGGQLLGLSYLKNEGDLNGDGTDEISYVINWADWSSTNSWYVMTYKNHKWQQLYSFDIWDWQLPDLPGTFNQYGLFGLEDKVIKTGDDSTNERLEKELLAFEGLVKKVKTNKIRVVMRTVEADMDTVIVDLSKPRKNP